MLKAAHHAHHLKFAEYHQNWTVEDWEGCCGVMKQR